MSAEVEIILKTTRADPAEKLQSRQEETARQPVERANNEGTVTCPPRTVNHPTRTDDQRRGRRFGWLDARTAVTADTQEEES